MTSPSESWINLTPCHSHMTASSCSRLALASALRNAGDGVGIWLSWLLATGNEPVAVRIAGGYPHQSATLGVSSRVLDGSYDANSYDDEDSLTKRRKGDPEPPNHVILITIINPAYPITVDVIHAITEPHGNVLRIVIFKTSRVQCMVEYEDVESATRAREALQGADIYAGCCTLRVEYAKQTKLFVHRNNAETWDYSMPGVSKLMVHRWVKHIHGINNGAQGTSEQFVSAATAARASFRRRTERPNGRSSAQQRSLQQPKRHA
ncbi:RNA recognition motif domain [Trinorchestia longiramus]|nr:RNA recognition motif domain [Trinorchestia longiramus]